MKTAKILALNVPGLFRLKDVLLYSPHLIVRLILMPVFLSLPAHKKFLIVEFLSAGKVTSLVAKKDLPLATRIEEAIKKNESLESLNAASIRQDATKSRQSNQKGRDANVINRRLKECLNHQK